MSSDFNNAFQLTMHCYQYLPIFTKNTLLRFSMVILQYIQILYIYASIHNRAHLKDAS